MLYECQYMYPPLIVNMKRLSKHVVAATNTPGTVKELLKASFSIRSVSYQRKSVNAGICCRNMH
jgi:hypothetical protein